MRELNRIPKWSRLKSSLSWSERIFVAVGVTTLAYCSIVVIDARVYQYREARAFEQELYGTSTSRPTSSLEHHVKPGPATLSVAEGFLVGRLDVPRLSVSVMVLEGIDKQTLERAVGHFKATALPGQSGNVALAGHRDTFFRALRYLRNNDEITLTGCYRYRVAFTEVVEPQDTSVLDASENDTLTLVTCYPFTFVGAAPERFIVRAKRIPG